MIFVSKYYDNNGLRNGGISAAKVMGKIAEAWKKLNAQERQAYNKLAEEDKLRY